MQDARRTTITGRAIPLRGNDIDTDRIIPARYLRTVTFDGLGDHVFEDDRKQMREAGKLHAFDDPRFSQATILVVNKNFGCGSSREHAPQAIRLWGQGIRAIVGESFAEIFFGNCLALGIPCMVVESSAAESLLSAVEFEPGLSVTVDVVGRRVRAGSLDLAAQIAEGPRLQLVEGRWDTTGELLSNADAIRQIAHSLPYMRGFS